MWIMKSPRDECKSAALLLLPKKTSHFSFIGRCHKNSRVCGGWLYCARKSKTLHNTTKSLFLEKRGERCQRFILDPTCLGFDFKWIWSLDYDNFNFGTISNLWWKNSICTNWTGCRCHAGQTQSEINKIINMALNLINPFFDLLELNWRVFYWKIISLETCAWQEKLMLYIWIQMYM